MTTCHWSPRYRYLVVIWQRTRILFYVKIAFAYFCEKYKKLRKIYVQPPISRYLHAKFKIWAIYRS